MEYATLSDITTKVTQYLSNNEIELLQRLDAPYKTFMNNHKNIIIDDENPSDFIYKINNYKIRMISNLPIHIFYYLDYDNMYNVIKICKQYTGVARCILLEKIYIVIHKHISICYPHDRTDGPRDIIYCDNKYKFCYKMDGNNDDYEYREVNEEDMTEELFNKLNGPFEPN